ncbi:MAG TPA: twin-arginine translocase subunit TatC [Chloroflexia bacterium]|nr:twin-arginine translocase subunit TatC [Chloroflexia bacterium]
MSTTAPSSGLRSGSRRKKRAPQGTVQIRPDGSRDIELPLREHLVELRSRLIKAALAVIITTGISLTFAEQEVSLLASLAGKDHHLIALKPTETFVAYIKVAFITGIAASMPIIVYQLFRFMAPGLQKREKQWILWSLPGITLFFVLGVLFCYFIVLPSALEFLLNFGGGIVVSTPTVSEFLSFVTRFLFAVGIAFETPLIVFMLAKLGVATPKRLSKFRRWAIVLAFVIAAIITPTPDPINQVIVAIPIIILYEIGVLFARLGVRTPKTAPMKRDA